MLTRVRGPAGQHFEALDGDRWSDRGRILPSVRSLPIIFYQRDDKQYLRVFNHITCHIVVGKRWGSESPSIVAKLRWLKRLESAQNYNITK